MRLPQEGIVLFFVGDQCGGSVAGKHFCARGQCEEFAADAVEKSIVITAREVCAANAAEKEDIARNDPVAPGIIKRQAAGRVSRCKKYFEGIISENEWLAFLNKECGPRGFFEIEAEKGCGTCRRSQDGCFLFVYSKRDVVLIC
jgi:hypothetical protein